MRKDEVSPALKFRGEKRQTSLCELLHKVEKNSTSHVLQKYSDISDGASLKWLR